jgi:hypothetical protein
MQGRTVEAAHAFVNRLREGQRMDSFPGILTKKRWHQQGYHRSKEEQGVEPLPVQA